MEQALNVGFFVFHTSWVVFNCVGWIWRRTRPWHLATTALTAVSWFGLGIYYGWGYCPCTDWHWQVRGRMGFDDPPSYIQLLISELTGLQISTAWADAMTVSVLCLVAALSVVLNLRDRRSASRRRPGSVD